MLRESAGVVLCCARNYRVHARELFYSVFRPGVDDLTPAPPVLCGLGFGAISLFPRHSKICGMSPPSLMKIGKETKQSRVSSTNDEILKF